MPPSETKRSGGDPSTSLDFSALSFASLDRPRRRVAAALARLSRDAETARLALKISPALAAVEVDRNKTLRRSPTLPALTRYTGVAFDPIAADTLTPDARGWAAEHVAIHSALFGLVGAGDAIPAYRLSHDSRLPELSLKGVWSAPVSRALAARGSAIVDLRSEGYAELGPAPDGSAYVRVVSDEGGRRRALNHFNKKTKGTLIARLVSARPALSSVDDFVSWARSEGMVVEPVRVEHAGARARADGRGGLELEIVAESVLEAR